MIIAYKPFFLRQLKKLSPELLEEAKEKIAVFAMIEPKKNRELLKTLKVHKLKGSLEGKWSFSVNYKYRIIFLFENDNKAVLLGIGDHEIYK